MWKDYMSKLLENSKFIKVNPPATIEEITEAENEIGINFPDDLKQCLLEVNGNDDCLYSIDHMVEINLLMKKLNPNDTFLRVGGNGCGDDIFYRTVNGKVVCNDLYMWWHEDDESTNEPVGHNLMEAIIKLYSD
jgi:cell wall assembly regulator SMI1